MEHETIVLIVPILAFVGGIALGVIYTRQQVHEWRIRWINLEHETARELDREPRKIDAYGTPYLQPTPPPRQSPIFEETTRPRLHQRIRPFWAFRSTPIPSPPPKPIPPLSSMRREDGGEGTCPECGSTLSRVGKSWMIACDNHPDCTYSTKKE